ncbi:MAG: B12-binding domain-containing protein [Chloroflexota bacterium]|nr:B12-binding domain-containing protein [Chloroflexota bacterium]
MAPTFDPELDEVARASDRPTYNTAAVEQRTGLRPATFRAWERRYGFPKPRRLPGNQRLYSDQDIAAIRWLQRRTDEGLSISHAIRLLRDRLTETVAYVPPAETPTGRPPAQLADELLRALVAFDSPTAELILSEAFAMYRVEEVCEQVIEPTLVEVGERWHRGELTVATEHYATSFIRRKLFALFNVYETGRGRGLVFTACAPEEWHEVGILMVSLFLVRHAYKVSYLGASLVPAGLAETLHHHRPDLIVISAASEETAEHLHTIADVIANLPEPRPLLAFGGRGFDDETFRRGLPGTYLGPTASSAVEMIGRLLGGDTGNGHRSVAS